ncbi:MAG: hypothetical protein IJU86_03000, partial [Firmicutes bacterium]|nr:hypothetical protein [Bacillota bacterium]
EIFCNKECCADYIRFVLNKPKDTAEDDLNENVISNIELVKKSANKNYDAIKIEKKASDAPKPEEFLNNGKFSGLPDEIKSAYLEKYFEVVDGGSFDYKKSFEDNLQSMLDKYQNYPEGVLLHILRLWFGNFETDINNKKNNGNGDFSSKKSLAIAIKNILDSNNFGSDEKKLALLWEYYEYFNGIDENEKLVEGQNKVEQFEDAIEKITNSDDFMKSIASDSIACAIITGKLKAYEIDTNFKEGYVNVLSNYNDTIKIAVIESFKFVAAPHYSEAEGNNKIKINDLCYGNGNYSNLSPKVRAKMIEKLSEVKATFDSAEFDKFADYLMKSYQINLNEVDSEIWVALFKLFLNSNPAIGANITQILTAMSEFQKQTENFTKQVDLNTELLGQLSCDLKTELRQFKEQQRQLRNAQLKKNIVHFFGKILFCLVFFIVAIPTLLIRWTLRFFWGILGWFINMFYCNWRRTNYKGQGFKNFGWEFFGFLSIGLIGAVARRWFISDPLAICQIFKNLWYRFFGDENDINNHQVYVTGFIVWTGNRNINGKDIVYRNDSDEKNFGVGDYFQFMSGYSEIINKSEAKGYPEDNVPLQSKLENINTDPNFSPLRYY